MPNDRKTEFQYSGAGSFPGSGECEFGFGFNCFKGSNEEK